MRIWHSLKPNNSYGHGFTCAKSAAYYLEIDGHGSQKAIWINPGGEVWIGDNPGEGWAELSRLDLEKCGESNV